MKNINKQEQVEVMALFSYGLTPCQPLRFKARGKREVEVTTLVKSQFKFLREGTEHIFDVLAGDKSHRLVFNSASLKWFLS